MGQVNIELVRHYIPQAPNLGLYVAPEIPSRKLRNAIKDYGHAVAPDLVLALYDATMFGSARDGALILADRIVFQNNDLESVRDIEYIKILTVDIKRSRFGGNALVLQVNKAGVTTEVKLDFSGKPEAVDYMARFIEQAVWTSDMLGEEVETDLTQIAIPPAAPEKSKAGTNIASVESAMRALVASGMLAEEDFERMVAALKKGESVS